MVDEALLEGARRLQAELRSPVSDLTQEAPDIALASLQAAVGGTPGEYRDYLDEALSCYKHGQLRAAVLMVWTATVEHLLRLVRDDANHTQVLQAANLARYGTSKTYREIKRVDDLLYMKESQLLLLFEDAGAFNRTARKFLEERLDLRNRCGHPTGYRPGRGEVVVFVESLLNNVLSGHMLNWSLA